MGGRGRTGHTAAAALAVGAAFLAAGCGGSSHDHPRAAPDRRSDAERAAAAVREQAQAVARGNGVEACGHFSPRALQEFQDLVSRRAGDIGCITAVREGAGRLPADVRRALAHPVITRVELHGDRASVTLRVPPTVTALAGKAGRARGHGTPLRRIDGDWKVDGLVL